MNKNLHTSWRSSGKGEETLGPLGVRQATRNSDEHQQNGLK